jgi:hypothetical protein
MSGTRRRRTKIEGQFAWRLVEMLNSPAFRVLSLSAHRVLTRLEIELGKHGGTENGRLPCTYDDFVDFGIHRHAIAPAIREVIALGFVEITEHGRAGNAEYRSPNKFRLTYRHTSDGAEPTNNWRRIKEFDHALVLAEEARKPLRRPRKNKIPVPENATLSVVNHH